MRGARGVLVNITGSRSLGLHEVNKACTLIRDAAGNDDVEINFGVVLNEAMGDEVKVTVIATGFERAGLPTITRRPRDHGALPSRSADPCPWISDAPRASPRRAAPCGSGRGSGRAGTCLCRAASRWKSRPSRSSQYEEPPMAAAAHANGPSEPLFDDLDVPAILKRDRRFVQ